MMAAATVDADADADAAAVAYITHHFQLRERARGRRCSNSYTLPKSCHGICKFQCWHHELAPASRIAGCHHDWYAFMPFEYKIRDSSAPHSPTFGRQRMHTIFTFCARVRCAFQMQNLAFVCHVHLTGFDLWAPISIEIDNVWTKNATTESELKFK